MNGKGEGINRETRTGLSDGASHIVFVIAMFQVLEGGRQ